MTITALPVVPNRSQAPAAFISTADAFLAALPTFVTEANALAASINSVSAGTASAIPYVFSTTTTDSDPGDGLLRLDNTTQNTATTIRADLSGSDLIVYTGVLDTFDDSSSTVKGQIKLVKASDTSKWLLFNITALASPSGYKNLTVVNTASSAVSPFSNGDALLLTFTRTGDAGATGPVATPFKPGMAANRYYGHPFATSISTGTFVADRLCGIPIFISESCTITKIGMQVQVGAAGNARLGIYNIDSDGNPSTLLLDAGTVSTAASGEKEIAISQSLVTGWYFLAVVADNSTATFRSISATSASSFIFGGVASANDIASSYGLYAAHAYAALPTPFGSPTFALMSSNAFPNLWVRI